MAVWGSIHVWFPRRVCQRLDVCASLQFLCAQVNREPSIEPISEAPILGNQSRLRAMASILRAMASNLLYSDGLQPNSESRVRLCQTQCVG